MGRKFLFLLFSLCLPFLRPAAAPAQESGVTLRALSAEIHGQLDDLRRQSRHLTEQLLVAESELQASSRQAEALQTELRDLNFCLENTNQKLTGYSTTLTKYEAELARQKGQLRFWWMVFGITATIKAVLLFLKFRFGIKVPYIVSLLF